MDSIADKLETELGFSFVPGNQVIVLRNGVEIFPAMLESIRAARETIDMVTYVYWKGDIAKTFAEALAERAEAGIVVRLLLDAVGCKLIANELIELMEDAGVNVCWFRPLARWKVWKVDNRTHRKILICDRKVAFTGGVGIAREWEGDARNEDEWRDTHFQVEGPVVRYIHSGFLANWREACSDEEHVTPDYPDTSEAGGARIQVVRSASAIYWCDTAVLFRTVLEEASSSICIATAYFVPDDRLTELLCKAVKRGVDVKLLLPWRQTDQVLSQISGGDHFRRLLEVGVKLFRFKPTMLHTKIVTIDHKYAIIGSANMNQRSMAKDEELCLVVDDEHTVSALEQDYEQDLTRSERFELGSWKKRSMLRRVAELASRVLRKEL